MKCLSFAFPLFEQKILQTNLRARIVLGFRKEAHPMTWSCRTTITKWIHSICRLLAMTFGSPANLHSLLTRRVVEANFRRDSWAAFRALSIDSRDCEFSSVVEGSPLARIVDRTSRSCSCKAFRRCEDACELLGDDLVESICRTLSSGKIFRQCELSRGFAARACNRKFCDKFGTQSACFLTDLFSRLISWSQPSRSFAMLAKLSRNVSRCSNVSHHRFLHHFHNYCWSSQERDWLLWTHCWDSCKAVELSKASQRRTTDEKATMTSSFGVRRVAVQKAVALSTLDWSMSRKPIADPFPSNFLYLQKLRFDLTTKLISKSHLNKFLITYFLNLEALMMSFYYYWVLFSI